MFFFQSFHCTLWIIEDCQRLLLVVSFFCLSMHVGITHELTWMNMSLLRWSIQGVCNGFISRLRLTHVVSMTTTKKMFRLSQKFYFWIIRAFVRGYKTTITTHYNWMYFLCRLGHVLRVHNLSPAKLWLSVSAVCVPPEQGYVLLLSVTRVNDLPVSRGEKWMVCSCKWCDSA